MPSDPGLRRIILRPGDVAFAEGATILQTLLGSCVAITFWDPRFKVGAMCHYMLPVCPPGRDPAHAGRYADATLDLITEGFKARGIRPEALHVRMFGGGDMFKRTLSLKKRLIGELNIEAGRYLLEELGYAILEEDLAGEVSRRVIFHLPTGTVEVERGGVLGVSGRIKP
ncbi:MAG TPA: chemotaxis protein CheD [Holophagaceae bacterium]|nr:chemotaxis protein CheD [Holophagaceae bacterium]